MQKTQDYKYVGKRVPRIDARDKATGRTVYPTDRYFKDMLWAKVLRSEYAHAKILKLNVDKARKLSGVEAVLTYRDVPGHNGFGIIEPNWPVLCEDRVRFRGDAVALVAAQDEETAEKAISLIEVEYEPLPVIDTSEEALKSDAPQIHKNGNIMYTNEMAKGDVKKGFAESDIVLDETYSTQFQEHAYLETEGGVAVYDEKEGIITVWCGDQYAFLDQLQIARALNLDPEKIRVIGSPVGGAFGGKYEINVQIHLALLTYCTKKPVRLHWTREESVVTGEKRHAMRSTFKIGAKKDGQLVAIDVNLVSNNGAYGGISPAVLGVAMECFSGPYKYGHSHIKGLSIYTNNAMGGSFRGFGAPQVTFGIEQQIDSLAKHLNMDPIQFRLLNAVEKGDTSALGYKLQGSTGVKEALQAAQKTGIWQRREEIKEKLNSRSPFEQYGVGIAAAIGPIGMGGRLPDYANVVIELGEKGKVILRTGAIEIGQGNLTAYAQILAEGLEYDIHKIEVINGDTILTPDSGPVIASRSIVVVGNAILNAVQQIKHQIIKIASARLNISEDELEYKEGKVASRIVPDQYITLERLSYFTLSEGKPLKVKGHSNMSQAAVSSRLAQAKMMLIHKCYTYTVGIALVGVNTRTGKVDVIKFVTLPDIGRAINIAGAEGQCEGAVVQAQGYTLFEEVIVKDGKFLNRNFSTYIIPTSMDVPEHETVMVEKPYKDGPFGAKGLGEPPFSPVAPAIANAIHDAVGIRLTELPITPEKVWRALKMRRRF